MRKLVFLTAAVIVAAVAGLAQADERRIAVTGTGQVEAAPDMAVITLGVTEQAPQAQEAMRANSEAVARVLERLADMGVESRDVQTRDLSLSPVWSNRRANQEAPPEITGYVASNRVVVRVRELSALGRILDAAITDGANDFNGLQFSVAEPKPLTDAARAKAVADAVDKAGQLAAAAGVTLGPVVSITEGGGGPRPVPRMAEMAMADSGAVPVAAGEVSVSVSVSMVFEIAE
ncbi:hypothetical protein SAMN05444007_105126 [Cribrihabitans marinus]|uniref:26 kDa periplasmic immunogenic protein n=1 Tax=Cribrihabitans marinus TaxID=1227549 RepID=A0A1H6ZRB7_9RHOB|nr:SIMPL domain-containing protein [Cribrihabitans marinus]GGH30735.1 hypothetical protein GCM10010973_21100 [Cribrihabitans marinus]SEJ52252.1 hypothetical protein SAMN05444007_105126 [Cribrihabitans marinus]